MTLKTLTLQCGAVRSRLINLRTMSSNAQSELATEKGQGPQEAIVTVSLFFTKRGKAVRISERKTSLDAK